MSDCTSLQHTILAPESYFDAEIFRQEQRRIFGHAWLHVCHATQIPNPGDYLTCTAGDQNIIVMRGHDKQIRAFYNACRHRGTELLQGGGCRLAIVCPYHGWTYHTDGSLKFARGSEFVPGFAAEKLSLPRLALEMIAGFVFVNLDPHCEPLSQTYPGFEQELRSYEPRLDELVHVRSTTFDLAVNWKLAVENYLEAYHLLTVHPSLRNSCRNDEWILTNHERHMSMFGSAGPGAEVGFFDEAEKRAQTNWWLWPMVMFEQMPGTNQVFTYNHIALGPERTLQVVDFYFLSDTLTTQQGASIDYVEQVVRIEDKASIEAWQRGLHSRGWRAGPLMMGPDMPEELTEKSVFHFQTLVKNELAAMPSMEE